MTYLEVPAAYVDGQILNCLAGISLESDAVREQRNALERIWRYFKEERVRLVTSGDELEQDIIIGLNGLGCCVTDAIQITDNIDEFEKWKKVDKDELAKWRKIIDLYDQLEFLEECGEYSGDIGKNHDVFRDNEGLLTFLRNEVFQTGVSWNSCADYRDEDGLILQDCANELREWYPKELWKDLRRVEYDINWRILERVLLKHSLEPAFCGKEAVRNKYLLGLLNRVVGFGKKSCPQLPLEQNHIRFIIDAVMKKYYHRQDRIGIHVVKCMEFNVDYFLSIEEALVDMFNKKRDILLTHPSCKNVKLQFIRPAELLSRL